VFLTLTWSWFSRTVVSPRHLPRYLSWCMCINANDGRLLPPRFFNWFSSNNRESDSDVVMYALQCVIQSASTSVPASRMELVYTSVRSATTLTTAKTPLMRCTVAGVSNKELASCWLSRFSVPYLTVRAYICKLVQRIRSRLGEYCYDIVVMIAPVYTY